MTDAPLGRWRATYTPGDWLLLCGPDAAVVLEPADSTWSDLVETLWDETVSATSIGDLASRLAWYRIDTMPTFAAFFWGPDGMRSLVRGGIAVVDADTGDVVATGKGVQTWVETGLGDLRQVRVDLPAERPAGAFALPLVVGVVGVSTVFLDAADGAAAAAVPPSEPAESDVVAAHPLVAEEGTNRTAHENADTRWVPIPELPGQEAAPAVSTTPPPPPALPTVDAVFCAWGHPNPPGAGRCRVCAAVVAVQPPRAIPAPVLAVLRATNGDTAEVVTGVLVGRAPSPDKARSSDPELLTVNSPSHDISRTHLEVFVDGWDVRVTDLQSTNGTLLVAPNGARRTMRSGETATVELGTTAELADGMSVLIDFPQ